METPRPLHDVFDDLATGQHTGDPVDALRAAGHGDLPEELLSDAIAHYAGSADAAVAEHLAPFVTDPGPAIDGLNLLVSAPGADLDDDVFAAAEAARLEEVSVGGSVDDLDFGTGDLTGTGAAAAVDAEPETDFGVDPVQFAAGPSVSTESVDADAVLPEAFGLGVEEPGEEPELDG